MEGNKKVKERDQKASIKTSKQVRNSSLKVNNARQSSECIGEKQPPP